MNYAIHCLDLKFRMKKSPVRMNIEIPSKYLFTRSLAVNFVARAMIDRMDECEFEQTRLKG